MAVSIEKGAKHFTDWGIFWIRFFKFGHGMSILLLAPVVSGLFIFEQPRNNWPKQPVVSGSEVSEFPYRCKYTRIPILKRGSSSQPLVFQSLHDPIPMVLWSLGVMHVYISERKISVN